jgi:hypothetical protein
MHRTRTTVLLAVGGEIPSGTRIAEWVRFRQASWSHVSRVVRCLRFASRPVKIITISDCAGLSVTYRQMQFIVICIFGHSAQILHLHRSLPPKNQNIVHWKKASNTAAFYWEHAALSLYLDDNKVRKCSQCSAKMFFQIVGFFLVLLGLHGLYRAWK